MVRKLDEMAAALQPQRGCIIQPSVGAMRLRCADGFESRWDSKTTRKSFELLFQVVKHLFDTD
jgi:hypothetical protein